MVTPHVMGRIDAVSTAIAAGLRSVVQDFGVPVPPRSESVVVVIGIDPGCERAGVDTVTAAQWHEFAERPMRQVLDALQQSFSALRDRGGRIVLVVPSLGMTGAPHLVACATAVEGIRAMAKSAARQWASDDVIVNMVAAPLHIFAPALKASTAHVTAAANQDDRSIVESLVEATRFLLRRETAGVIGETVVVDGGAVMLP